MISRPQNNTTSRSLELRGLGMPKKLLLRVAKKLTTWKLTAWWLNQPAWKNMSQNGHLPQFSGWKLKKYLKPPAIVKHQRGTPWVPPICQGKLPKSHKSQGTQNQAFPHQRWFPSCHLASFWSLFSGPATINDKRLFFSLPNPTTCKPTKEANGSESLILHGWESTWNRRITVEF